MTNWKKVETGNAHDFEKNVEVEGTLISKVPGSFGGTDYVLEASDGSQHLVYGSAVLKTKLNAVQVGTQVKIVCVGKVKSPKSGREYMSYDVFVAE